MYAVLVWAAAFAPRLAHAQQPFITTWTTSNTSSGSSNSTSITIPTYTGDVYNYQVDWNNDGVYDQSGITGNVTHDYGVAGTYTIRIRGTFPRIYFAGGNDGRKLINIVQWGDNAWTTMNSAFYNCYNLDVTATDVPNLSGVTDMFGMFYNCINLTGPANIHTWNTSTVTSMAYMFVNGYLFNQPIGSWNTANVTNMSFMFNGASVFNQPLDNWSVANVTNMTNMFNNASSFNQSLGNWNLRTAGLGMGNMLNNCGMDCDNYTLTLNGWSANPNTPNNCSMGATGRQYGTNAAAARTNLTTTKGWTISGDAGTGQACPLALPVELIRFTGQARERSILLEWATIQEENNRGFYIEHSIDAMHWNELGFVSGSNRNAVEHYSFVDAAPSPRLNYYRLRLVSFNGKEDVSDVVSVDLSHPEKIRIFPNPVTADVLTVVLADDSDATGTVQLFNATGELVSTASFTDNTLSINISGLSSGVYILKAGSFFEKVIVH